jgi:hypothetical protein
MTKKSVRYGPSTQLDDAVEEVVRLAIAEFVIRRVSGTPAGEEIFDGLIKRFENRYPQHKLLSQYLLSPGYVDSGSDVDDIY